MPQYDASSAQAFGDSPQEIYLGLMANYANTMQELISFNTRGNENPTIKVFHFVDEAAREADGNPVVALVEERFAKLIGDMNDKGYGTIVLSDKYLSPEKVGEYGADGNASRDDLSWSNSNRLVALLIKAASEAAKRKTES